MKVGEQRELYTNQYNQIVNPKKETDKKLQNQTNPLPDSERGVILELSGQTTDSTEKVQDFFNSLSEQKSLQQQAESARQDGDVMADESEEMAKCMEIARRISSGGKVPAKDERKLMEYNMKLYMAAKNAAMMNEHNSKKEYKSLWDDEDAEKPDTSELENTSKIDAQIESTADNSDVLDTEA